MDMKQFLPHTLTVGRRKIAVRDLSDAAFAYADALDANPTAPDGRISIGDVDYTVTRQGVFAGATLVMGAQ